MAKDTIKGIGKESLSEEQETIEEQENEEITQEQTNGVQTEEENEQQENEEKIKYKTGHKMLVTDFGSFIADENGYFNITKEQYNKIIKK